MRICLALRTALIGAAVCLSNAAQEQEAELEGHSDPNRANDIAVCAANIFYELAERYKVGVFSRRVVLTS